MSELVIGLSHRTTPIALLERAVASPDLNGLATRLCSGDHVREAAVLATCNRLEIYTDISRFHGAVADFADELAGCAGVPFSELAPHLYVHYEQAAVRHLFKVVCGLESMALGEQQILGQVRHMLGTATDDDTVGPVLNHLLQRALHVGKRARTETDLDAAGHCLVGTGIELARDVLGDLDHRRALVVGAGTMSSLAVASLARAGVGGIDITSRTHDRALRLAETVDGLAVPAGDLSGALARADLIVCCTGTPGYRLDLAAMRQAVRDRDERPTMVIDLALPRDVDPKIASLPGVTLLDLEQLGQSLADTPISGEIDQVRAIVDDEVHAYIAEVRAQAVVPAVVALRDRAQEVVQAELERLTTRLPDAGPRVLEELERSVHRIVEKLLHTPTVRAKQMAGEPGGSQYAQVLGTLFDLETEQVTAVCTGQQPLPAAAVRRASAIGGEAQ